MCHRRRPRSTIFVAAATDRSLSPRRRFQAYAHQSVTSPGAAVASEHLEISGGGPESGLGAYQTIEPTGLTRKPNSMYQSPMMVTPQGNGTHAIHSEADFGSNL